MTAQGFPGSPLAQPDQRPLRMIHLHLYPSRWRRFPRSPPYFLSLVLQGDVSGSIQAKATRFPCHHLTTLDALLELLIIEPMFFAKYELSKTVLHLSCVLLLGDRFLHRVVLWHDELLLQHQLATLRVKNGIDEACFVTPRGTCLPGFGSRFWDVPLPPTFQTIFLALDRSRPASKSKRGSTSASSSSACSSLVPPFSLLASERSSIADSNLLAGFFITA